MHDLSARKPVVPFRNSALTRLLQPSLAGQAVVAVLVTAPILPGASFFPFLVACSLRAEEIV